MTETKSFEALLNETRAAHEWFKSLQLHTYDPPAALSLFSDCVSAADRKILQGMLVEWKATLEQATNEFGPGKASAVRNAERARLAADPRGGASVRSIEEILTDLYERRSALLRAFREKNTTKYLEIVKPALRKCMAKIESGLREAIADERKLAEKFGIPSGGGIDCGFVGFVMLALHHKILRHQEQVNQISVGMGATPNADLIQLFGETA